MGFINNIEGQEGMSSGSWRNVHIFNKDLFAGAEVSLWKFLIRRIGDTSLRSGNFRSRFAELFND
jgi:hypothetical protein